ncbi:MAG: hypothetical protein HFE60_02270 [Anaerotignum sp.]|mgnify:FL=1|nr:hypothetical protein [Anaerotignum sp.]
MFFFYLVLLLVSAYGLVTSPLKAVEKIANAAVKGEKAGYAGNVIIAMISLLVFIWSCYAVFVLIFGIGR